MRAKKMGVKKGNLPKKIPFVRRGDRTRTCDSLVPNQERYQLRYTPIASFTEAVAKVQPFLHIAKFRAG